MISDYIFVVLNCGIEISVMLCMVLKMIVVNVVMWNIGSGSSRWLW